MSPQVLVLAQLADSFLFRFLFSFLTSMNVPLECETASDFSSRFLAAAVVPTYVLRMYVLYVPLSAPEENRSKRHYRYSGQNCRPGPERKDADALTRKAAGRTVGI